MTQPHTQRVAARVARLAQAGGGRTEDVVQLREAALVHDVGKVAVPDHILARPGRLSEEETKVVRGHAVLGAQIAADILTREQTAWIRGHHERPDGLGYPDGLDASEMSEGVQLLALADAWDAMRSSRPYREALSVEEALAECHALVGHQFTAWAVAMLERVHADGRLASP
jgi:HD-GYP domain-containing protein (c-di-GMP phosphodiesterase class II)